MLILLQNTLILLIFYFRHITGRRIFILITSKLCFSSCTNISSRQALFYIFYKYIYHNNIKIRKLQTGKELLTPEAGKLKKQSHYPLKGLPFCFSTYFTHLQSGQSPVSAKLRLSDRHQYPALPAVQRHFRHSSSRRTEYG